MIGIIQMLATLILLIVVAAVISSVWWALKFFIIIFGYGLLSIMIFSLIVFVVFRVFWYIVSGN